MEQARCESPRSCGSKTSDATHTLVTEPSPHADVAHEPEPTAEDSRLQLLSEQERKAVGVLQTLLPIVDGRLSWTASAMTDGALGQIASAADLSPLSVGQRRARDEASSAISNPRRKKMRNASRGVAAAAAAAGSFDEDGVPIAQPSSSSPQSRGGASSAAARRGARGPSTAWRRKSNCHYCEPLGLNCGLVAGKCPNRPCKECGGRHRLGRCRRSAAVSRSGGARRSSNSAASTAAARRKAAAASAAAASAAASAPVPLAPILETEQAAAAAAAPGDMDNLSVPGVQPSPSLVPRSAKSPKEERAAGRLAPRFSLDAAATATAAAMSVGGKVDVMAAAAAAAAAANGTMGAADTRKRSACRYCQQLGLNCGLVAGKCPNRPCFECGGRHRHGRCRLLAAAAVGGAV